MSNLGQQFEPLGRSSNQDSRDIKNNKTRLTRVLNAHFLGPRRRVSKRRGQSHMSSGVVYTPIDVNTTEIHWRGETFTKENTEFIQEKHQRIHDVLKDAGFNVSMKDGKVHVQH